MSKRSAVLLLCAALLAAGGCAHRESGSGKGQEYLIYYSALSNRESESAVAGEHRALSAGQETVPALMSLLLSQPESAGLTSPFPSGLRLLDWQLEEGRLHLDLSDHYYSLSGVDLTLADACLAPSWYELPPLVFGPLGADPALLRAHHRAQICIINITAFYLHFLSHSDLLKILIVFPSFSDVFQRVPGRYSK